MKKNPLVKKNMRVVVLGFGVTGISAARYLYSLGAKVYISDVQSKDNLAPQQEEVLQQCCLGFEGGGHTEPFLAQAELVFLSPGIPTTLEVLDKTREAGVPIIGELALVAPVLTSQVIAITGTNGKTTVTSLIGELLKETGKTVFIGGNIGKPLLECVMETKQPDIAVLEISSFQLENAGKFRPEIGIILNITPDHLDRHGNIAEYIKAKSRLFEHQQEADKAIICTDNVICMELADHLKSSEPLLFGHSKDCNGYICESEIYVRWEGKIEKYQLAGTVFDNHIGRLNCAAAILAARYGGCDRKAIEKVLLNFQLLPHRMEDVDVINDVVYCNDSKATNTGAVISALTQARGKVILIAGGRDKGDEYSLLRDAVAQKVRKAVLIGEAATKIADEIDDLVGVEYAASMDDAVVKASIAAEPGDTVLLSPACASFDMFESYGHRGQAFKESVQKLRNNSSIAKVKSGNDRDLR